MPLFYFLLDTAVIYSFKISFSVARKPYEHPWAIDLHKRFRMELADALIKQSVSRMERQFQGEIYPVSPRKHQMIKLGPPKNCISVKPSKEWKRRLSGQSRKALTEQDPNVVGASPSQRRGGRYPMTTRGCSVCRAAICSHKDCWRQHMEPVKLKTP